eukprot:CAMPEP_0206241756 /NCGR_PEP_ID=MMETSP0047_2-20121206/16675_1 /ASSEMBLY_ACC=CAM_ASM_000192 /TAXON_ID=195065 /ORGANISM="Chroomonas mesostigmatica_cf, Strain CCMP1168" /LENGTH=152 /DNA_ID=CAMNT_0053666693 /DNA_START=660 /DNA_END=1118 /DNA_ORIENTATION=-
MPAMPLPLLPVASWNTCLMLTHCVRYAGRGRFLRCASCLSAVLMSQSPHVTMAKLELPSGCMTSLSSASTNLQKSLSTLAMGCAGSTVACSIPVRSVQKAERVGSSVGLTYWWNTGPIFRPCTSRTMQGHSMISFFILTPSSHVASKSRTSR